MKIKEGASIQGLQIIMRPVLVEADKIWEKRNQELVITSGTEDIAHSAGSLHPYGLALDFRTRYFSRQDQHFVTVELRDRLESINLDYDVALEENHIHVEYDE